MSVLYTAHATATGGRNGEVKSSDGLLSFGLSIPKEMGGPGRAGATNPEQLFACGYAACFCSAIEFVARMQKLALSHLDVSAAVGIGKDATSFALSVVLSVRIGGLDAAAAQSLVEAAHQVCPYSKATRNNVPVELKVELV